MDEPSIIQRQSSYHIDYLPDQLNHFTLNQAESGSGHTDLWTDGHFKTNLADGNAEPHAGQNADNDNTCFCLQLVIKQLQKSLKSDDNGVSILKEKNCKGKTPIMLAAEKGLSATLSEMLNFASAEEKVGILLLSDDNGFTALHWAVLSRDVETIESIRHSIVDQWDVWYQLVCSVDNNNCTAVHLATKMGNPDAISLLLEGFGEMQTLMNLKTASKDKKETAVHYAACKPGCIEAMMECITNPEDKIDLLQAVNFEKDTLLHLSVKNFCPNSDEHESIACIMQFLVPEKKFTFLALPNALGLTALHVAAAENNVTLAVELLEVTPVQHRLDLLGLKDIAGDTPIDFAKRHPEEDSLLFWLEIYQTDAACFGTGPKEQQLSASNNWRLINENREMTEEILDLRQQLENKEGEKKKMAEKIRALQMKSDANEMRISMLVEEVTDLKNIQSVSHIEWTTELKKYAQKEENSQAENEKRIKKLQSGFDELKVKVENQEAVFASMNEEKNQRLTTELDSLKQRLEEKDEQERRNVQKFRNLEKRLKELAEAADQRFDELWGTSVAREKQTGRAIGFSRSKESSLQEQINELCRRIFGDEVFLLHREVHG